MREYVLDNNGTQAAIRAGYSPHTAGVQACEHLKEAKIAAAIAASKAQRLAAINTTVEQVLSGISALAQSNIDHYEISDEGRVVLAEGAPRNAMEAIQSIQKKTRVETRKVGDELVTTKYYDVTVKLWDKPGPQKLLGKHAGVKACFDRVEVSGPDGGPIPIAEVRSIVVDVKAQ